jgi:hypothetical protein
MPKERGDSGQYVPTVGGDDVLDVLTAVDGPVVTTADVADALDVSRETARRKLNALVDDGALAKRKTAGRVVFWRPDDGGGEPASGGENPAPSTPRPSPPDLPRDDGPRGSAGERGGEVPDDVEAAVAAVADGWDDSTDRLAARRSAATAVLRHAVETGEAVGKSDATDRFLPEYAVEGQNAETWWRKNIRPVLKEYGTYDNGAHGYRVDPDGWDITSE